MNCLIKCQKYSTFVGIRKVCYSVDKLQFNFILFIYYILFYFLFINLFYFILIFYANFILFNRLLINEMWFWSNPSFVRSVLMIRLDETSVDFSDSVGIYIYIYIYIYMCVCVCVCVSVCVYVWSTLLPILTNEDPTVRLKIWTVRLRTLVNYLLW